MNLTELKNMIKEEYVKYTSSSRRRPTTRRRRKLSEQELPMGMGADAAMGGPGGPGGAGAPEPTIAVSDDDVDAMGGKESPEETLRDIFNMLKDYFEGDDSAPKPPSAPKKAADKGGDDKPKGGAKAKGGDDKPKGGAKKDDDKKDDKEDDKEDEKEALQERFQKLANIIKG